MAKEKCKVVSYNLPETVLKKIDKLSKDNGWVKSLIVKNILKEYFGLE